MHSGYPLDNDTHGAHGKMIYTVAARYLNHPMQWTQHNEKYFKEEPVVARASAPFDDVLARYIAKQKPIGRAAPSLVKNGRHFNPQRQKILVGCLLRLSASLARHL